VYPAMDMSILDKTLLTVRLCHRDIRRSLQAENNANYCIYGGAEKVFNFIK